MTKSLFDISKHFTVTYLAEGVYGAIHTEGGAAICNAGLIDLGGLLVVFDTFLTPQAARDLKQFALDTLGKVPEIVINSHYHNDHVWGNQEFDSAEIISSIRTRELFDTEGNLEFAWYQAHAVEKLEFYRGRLQQVETDNDKISLLGLVGYYEGLVKALPHLSICKPGLTFERRLALHGEIRSAELIAFEGAHTDSDVVLFLPADGILFMSDLLFIRSHPYLSEGDPHKILAVLEELLAFDVNTYVPGHGPIGTREDVTKLVDYVKFCIDTAEEFAQAGSSLEELLKMTIPEKFRDWRMPQMFPGNLESIYQKKRDHLGISVKE